MLALLVRLEHADQVTRLRLVEVDRVPAPPPGRDLLLVQAQQELQRHHQRRRPRGSVIGIGGVALPLAGDGLGRGAVTAASSG